MNETVQLIPLVCVKCQTPIPAQPDEVAWVCEQCQQAQMLDDQHGLHAIQIQYAKGILANARGKPFWVASGHVTLRARATYKGDQSTDAAALWSTPRLFCIPAYEVSLEQLADYGTRFLLQPPAFQPGPPSRFEPVRVAPADLQALGEFIVLSIEAGRRDDLREVQFELKLEDAQLWILP